MLFTAVSQTQEIFQHRFSTLKHLLSDGQYPDSGGLLFLSPNHRSVIIFKNHASNHYFSVNSLWHKLREVDVIIHVILHLFNYSHQIFLSGTLDAGTQGQRRRWRWSGDLQNSSAGSTQGCLFSPYLLHSYRYISVWVLDHYSGVQSQHRHMSCWIDFQFQT